MMLFETFKHQKSSNIIVPYLTERLHIEFYYSQQRNPFYFSNTHALFTVIFFKSSVYTTLIKFVQHFSEWILFKYFVARIRESNHFYLDIIMRIIKTKKYNGVKQCWAKINEFYLIYQALGFNKNAFNFWKKSRIGENFFI